jgi:hypothetical protein
LFAHGRWFSPGTPASSTTKTDIAEILLKVALDTKNQSNQFQHRNDVDGIPDFKYAQKCCDSNQLYVMTDHFFY